MIYPTPQELRDWADDAKDSKPWAPVSRGTLRSLADRLEAPIDMVLHCPACDEQHIDAPEFSDDAVLFGAPGCMTWTNPPHRSHLCRLCGHVWRPADVPTNGVQAVKTKGKMDSPLHPGGPR